MVLFLKKLIFNLSLLSCIFLLVVVKDADAGKLSKNLEKTEFYFLVDVDTGEILLSKNPDKRISPSSMTKLMTAYVVLDQIKKGELSFDNQCRIGRDAWRKTGSSMFLNHGDVVTIRKLIRGLLAVSGNDAAVALAGSSAENYDDFISLMNKKAQELGMNNSGFKNPHGLFEKGHYMSVRDLAILATNFCHNFPNHLNLLGIPKFTYGNITQRNRNPLMKRKYDGTIGGKTGHTNDGGYGVIGVVKRDHRRLVGVINKARTPQQRSQTIIDLFDYGFKNFKKIVLFEKGQDVADLRVWLGDKKEVGVVTGEKIALNIPRDQSLEDVNVRVDYLGPFYPPITKGAKIANLVVEIDGYKTVKYPLFAKEKLGKVGYFGRVNQILRYKISHFLL